MRTIHHSSVLGLAAVAVAGALAVPALPAPAAPGRPPRPTVELISVASDESQRAQHARINGSANVASADGRFVVFSTVAALSRRDRNGEPDVYRRDTREKRTVLVSRTRTGAAGDGASVEPTVSADGTVVAWTTYASDLVPGRRDRNGAMGDVVVRDLVTERVVLASVDGRGRQRRAQTFFPVLSGDGRHVALQTFAQLAPHDDDRREDVYVRDLDASRTRKASWTVRGRDISQPHLVGTLSYDGRIVTMGDDRHVWARDVVARRTTLVWSEEIAPDADLPIGTVGRPAVSGNGRYVVFASAAVKDLRPTRGEPNVYRRDLETGALVRVTRGLGGAAPDADSGLPSISHTGRYVGLSSFAGNLDRGDAESGDGDAFVVDLETGRTHLASPGPEGEIDETARTGVAITLDGRSLVYESFDEPRRR